MITANQEDYLRAMYHLYEENKLVAAIKHNHNTEVESQEIARYLEVSKPSVSKMMNELSTKGFVQFEKYGKLTFTSQGKKIAKNIIAKHRVIELFLKKILKISESKIHNLAHKLEHAFDDECIDKIKDILGQPTFDPHGKPIPQ